MPPKQQQVSRKERFQGSGKKSDKSSNEENQQKKVFGRIDELPVLQYVSGKGTTNFFEFRKHFVNYAYREFGDLAKSLETEEIEYWEPPPIEKPIVTPPPPDADGTIPDYDDDAFSPDNDPGGFVQESLRELNKFRTRKIEKMREDRTKAYATLWGNMSAESKDKVREHPEFDEKSRDLLDLWMAIQATHLSNSAGDARMKEKEKSNARSWYNGCRQSKTETVARYKERLDEAVEKLQAVGETVPSQPALAMDFLSKLDPSRFSKLNTDIENDVLLGKGEYPKTLVEAYRIAQNFKVIRTESTGTSQVNTAQYVFVTKADSKKANKKNEKKEESKNSSKKSDDSKKQPKFVCPVCENGYHFAYECSELARCKSYLNGESSGNSNNNSTMHITKKSSSNNLSLTVLRQLALNGKHNSESIKLDDYDILLDNQSTVSIFHNANIVNNIRNTNMPFELDGIGGSLFVSKVADAGSFGQIYFHHKAKANILSFSEVLEKYKIEWDGDEKAFIVHINPLKTYKFKQKGRLFLCNVRSIFFSGVITVSEKEAPFTKREVKAAQEARDLKRKLGYPSDKDLQVLVRSGIKDSPVTEQDVARAKLLYGPDIADLKGKTKERKSKIASVVNIPIPIEARQSLHVDLMFIEGVIFLISVSKPLDYLMATNIISKSTEIVWKALWAQINAYKARSFSVNILLSDGEGAIAALSSRLNNEGIKVDPSGTGQHVPAVENKIRQVKERTRAHLSVLPFNLPFILLTWLVYFCVSRINMMPSHLRNDPSPPRELYTGRKIEYTKDLRVGFGDYCQCYTPRSDQEKNSMKPRTEGAIALLPVGNLQGSVKFFNLSTSRVITRDHWYELPMPSQVIDHLNQLASKEKRQLSKDPIFRIGSTQLNDEEFQNDEIDTNDSVNETIIQADTIFEEYIPPDITSNPGEDFLPTTPLDEAIDE